MNLIWTVSADECHGRCRRRWIATVASMRMIGEKRSMNARQSADFESRANSCKQGRLSPV